MAAKTPSPDSPMSTTSDRGGRGWTIAWNLVRIAVAALIVVATVEQARLAIVAAAGAGIDGPTAVFRLLSFFTVQSNALTAAVLVWAAARAFTSGFRAESSALAVTLAAVTTYMLVTGLVYNIVLRSAGDLGIMLGWSNDVHHVVVPAFMLVDLLIAPARRPLPRRTVAVILSYPLAWVAFTLLRGPHVISPSTGTAPWYPYPFLDPATTPGGDAGVAAWVAGIASLFTAVGLLVVLVGRLRARRTRQSA